MSFFEELKTDREVCEELVSQVKGLQLVYDFISAEEENHLLAQINAQPWLHDLKRRVQHYGYKYDYKARRIDASFYVGALPVWLQHLAERLVSRSIFAQLPDQAIINEYEPGQGIAMHIDCEPCFADTIVSLSLGSDCAMKFEQQESPFSKLEILLPRRSLVVLKGESRNRWMHGIAARQSDTFNNQKRNRSTRVSVTFRKVILD